MKMIKSLETTQNAMFVSLLGGGALALNTTTGDVQLEEHDAGAVLRSVILVHEIRKFAQRSVLAGKGVELRLLVEDNPILSFGVTLEKDKALTWINQANEVLDRIRLVAAPVKKRSVETSSQKTTQSEKIRYGHLNAYNLKRASVTAY